MPIISSRCVKIFSNVIDSLLITGVIGGSVLIIMYQESINPVFVYLIYISLIVTFCIRTQIDSRVLFRLDERENRLRINPIMIESNPIHVVEQV